MSKNNASAIIKRDTVKNWKKSNYIPAKNVIIIMDELNGTFRLAIGDGETNVNDLPNILDKTSKPSMSDNDILIL